MRTARLAALIALGLLAASGSPARASTWTVNLQGTVGTEAFQTGFQVTLPDPSGSVQVSVGGLPVVVSHTVDTFTVRLNDTRSTPACSIVFIVEGVTAPATTSGVPSAPGALTGVKRSTCQVMPYSIPPPPPPGPPPPGQVITTDPIGGSFTVIRVDGSDVSSVGAVTGTVTVRTPRSSRALAPGAALLPESLIQTGSDGGLVLAFQDGSQLNVGPNTLVTILPTDSGDIALNHIAGSLFHRVAPSTPPEPDRYQVQTPTATIQPTGTDFLTQVSLAGTVSTTVVSVQSGTVEVRNRQGQITSVVAGTSRSFQDQAPRVSPVLPVTEGAVPAGVSSAFIWTRLPGAVGYLFEFTFGAAGFAVPNAPTVQFSATSVPLPPGSFIDAGVTIELPVFVPGNIPQGTRGQWRVFGVDATGQILPGTIASDASTVIVQ